MISISQCRAKVCIMFVRYVYYGSLHCYHAQPEQAGPLDPRSSPANGHVDTFKDVIVKARIHPGVEHTCRQYVRSHNDHVA